MTWKELAVENYSAALHLYAADFHRAATNRCYYAVYSAVTDLVIAQRLTLPFGWNNPTHPSLPSIVRMNLGLSATTGTELSRYLIGLRMVREDADYRPSQIIDKAVASDVLRETARALSHFGIS